MFFRAKMVKIKLQSLQTIFFALNQRASIDKYQKDTKKTRTRWHFKNAI
jgi:hypothetical protein